MSAGWMAAIAALVTAQKLLPPKAALEVPLALAIVAFGVVIIADPSSVRRADATDVSSPRRLRPSRTMREIQRRTAQ
jgi:hypothetical protein